MARLIIPVIIKMMMIAGKNLSPIHARALSESLPSLSRAAGLKPRPENPVPTLSPSRDHDFGVGGWPRARQPDRDSESHTQTRFTETVTVTDSKSRFK